MVEFADGSKGMALNLESENVGVIQNNKTGVVVSTVEKDGNKNKFECDVVLISVGRKANTNSLNLESVGVEMGIISICMNYWCINHFCNIRWVW